MYDSLAAALIRRGVIKRGTILQIRSGDPYAPLEFVLVARARRVGPQVVFDGDGGAKFAHASQVVAVDGMQISRVAESVALDEVGNHAPQAGCRSPVDE